MCKQLKWVLSWKISSNLFNRKAHCPAYKTVMLLDVTDLAMQSTVIQIIHIYPLLSQPSTILFIVVFNYIIFVLKTLILLIFHSVYPDYQLCKAHCSCHLQINITKTHSIICWFYDPSLQFNCFIWLHKALAEINSFKSHAFFQGCLFPRYQSRYTIMFYHQRD